MAFRYCFGCKMKAKNQIPFAKTHFPFPLFRLQLWRFVKFWHRNKVNFANQWRNKGDLQGWNDIKFWQQNEGEKWLRFKKLHPLRFAIVTPLIKICSCEILTMEQRWFDRTKPSCINRFAKLFHLLFALTKDVFAKFWRRWFETANKDAN